MNDFNRGFLIALSLISLSAALFLISIDFSSTKFYIKDLVDTLSDAALLIFAYIVNLLVYNWLWCILLVSISAILAFFITFIKLKIQAHINLMEYEKWKMEYEKW